MKFKIVCDSKALNEKFKSSWGFSCYIENNNHILFDTGESKPDLANNMGELAIDPKDIEKVVLSHDHYDHVGGLEVVLEKNSNVEVCILGSFSDELKRKVTNYRAKLVEVGGFLKIAPDMYVTGRLGHEIPEQSLVVKTAKGLVIVTGCAHPGINNIVGEVSKRLSGDIFLVMGGFHLIGESKLKAKVIISELKGLGVQRVAPAHCTGDEATALFKKEYGQDCLSLRAGAVIEV